MLTRPLSRRLVLAAAPASLAAAAHAASDDWRKLDPAALDADYNQSNFAPNLAQITARFVARSAETVRRLGPPMRLAYGPGPDEKLDIYRTRKPRAPVFVFLHGGAWRSATARDCGFPAEMFVAAGAHYVVPDFAWVQNAQGNLMTLVDQARAALAWVYRNAQAFGGDPSRIYLGGHSSGGHLAAMCLTTAWPGLGLPAGLIKAGLCVSGLYDLEPVRHTQRASYIRFSDANVAALSPIRHLSQLRAPLAVLYGSFDSPEFQRQARDFSQAANEAGHVTALAEGEGYNHFDMMESLASPYAIAGRTALSQMALA